jgi:methyl-accepting chemotaxis protein
MISDQDQAIPVTAIVRKDWMDCLRYSENDLIQIVNGNESEFLAIGSRLKDLYSRAMYVPEIASTVIGFLSGNDIVGAIELMRSLLQRIGSYHELFISTTRLRIQQLENILKKIKDIDEPLSDFQNITKTLRVLSTTTKIQTALVGRSACGFNLLADDVKRLASLIDEKISVISQEIITLTRLFEETYAKLKSFEATQKEKIKFIFQHTDKAIASLSEKNNHARSAIEHILFRAEGISLSVGDIVTSIQFHDISRQKYEHIRKMMHDIYMSDDADEGKESKALISGLLVITEEFISAVHSITHSLFNIQKSVTDLLEEVQEITKKQESLHTSYLLEAEHTVSSITAALRSLSESADADSETSGAIMTLSHSTRKISGFVDDINKIGSDLLLISLNSAVKADEIGNRGASLGILADTIKKLADDSHGKVRDVSTAIESVTAEIAVFSQGIGDRTVVHDSDMKSMTDEVRGISDTLHNVTIQVDDLLKQIDTTTGQLAFDIRKAAETITVHNSVEKTVQGIITRLEQFSAHEAEWDQEKTGPLLETGTSLFDTMPVNGTGSGRQDSEDNVEFF